MAYEGACQVWTEGVTVPQLCYIRHLLPVAAVALLLAASVALLFSVCLRSFCYSSSPINAESAQGALLHPQPTPAVMVSERSKTHAQICNSFPALCLVET